MDTGRLAWVVRSQRSDALPVDPADIVLFAQGFAASPAAVCSVWGARHCGPRCLAGAAGPGRARGASVAPLKSVSVFFDVPSI